jgi:hypothetical protein
VRRPFAGLLLVLCGLLWSPSAWALIHTAPVVIQGNKIKAATHYPVNMYRLFKTDEVTGKAVPIPFQIDEINEWGDFVLPDGGTVTANTGNGIFDLQDELCFMGDDVGPVKKPTSWEGLTKPALLFEVKVAIRGGKNSAGDPEGAVYLGVYFQNPPKPSDKRYVSFNRDAAEILTSRYRYQFDTKNWLVARRVEMLRRGTERNAQPDFIPLLESTTFYMKADLKYFLTVEASHRSIDSMLEAYKIGPVRSIIRISFHYTFLKLNFELGMYTEVSFFSNAVYLPAILYNPLDGKKSLNTGSGFYYGMAMKENPNAFKIDTNMPAYKKTGLLDFLSGKPTVENLYWITAAGQDRMLYMEISPSKEMRAAGALPMLYREDVPGEQIKNRNVDRPSELGQSNVNMALYFDMTRFSEGEHMMAFRLFFENTNEEKKLTAFKTLGNWDISVARIRD